MKDELAASMRVALDHGATLDDAVQSFINAGYNVQEVRAAEDTVKSGAISITSPQQPKPVEKKPLPGEKVKSAHSKNMGLIAVIVAALVVLLGVLGYLVYTFFLAP